MLILHLYLILREPVLVGADARQVERLRVELLVVDVVGAGIVDMVDEERQPATLFLGHCRREVIYIDPDAAGVPEGVLFTADGQGERRVGQFIGERLSAETYDAGGEVDVVGVGRWVPVPLTVGHGAGVDVDALLAAVGIGGHVEHHGIDVVVVEPPAFVEPLTRRPLVQLVLVIVTAGAASSYASTTNA